MKPIPGDMDRCYCSHAAHKHPSLDQCEVDGCMCVEYVELPYEPTDEQVRALVDACPKLPAAEFN